MDISGGELVEEMVQMSTLDLEEAAALAGMSREVLRRKFCTRQAPSTKVGRTWVTSKELFEAWLVGEFRMPVTAFKPDSRVGTTMRRRAQVLQRTPAWANRDAIKAIYKEAVRLTRVTRTKHHVDHVIPIRGRTVSGLHVENNLQILTATENSQKCNHFEDDDPQ